MSEERKPLEHMGIEKDGVVKSSDLPEHVAMPAPVAKAESVTMDDIKVPVPQPMSPVNKEGHIAEGHWPSDVKAKEHKEELARRIAEGDFNIPGVPLCMILPDNSWQGERVFIIGGGPSLKGFDFSQLKGEKVIAINRAIEHYPDADILYFTDHRFWTWVERGELGEATKKAFDNMKGIKVAAMLETNIMPEDVRVVKHINRRGLSSTLEEGIQVGTNSGVGAIEIARLLGAGTIYLLGYDMKGHEDGSPGWFHDGYPDPPKKESYSTFLSNFNDLGPLFNGKVKIINVNKESHLNVFPFGDLPDDLKGKPKTTKKKAAKKTAKK